MKKILTIAALGLLTAFSANAQKDDDATGFKFRLGGAVSLPMGDLKESHSYGVGVEANATYGFSESIEAFLQTGFHAFQGKDLGFGYKAPNFGHIPIIAGAHFKTSGLLIGGGVGYGLWTASGGGGSSSGFLFSPRVGYDFSKVRALLSYTSTSLDGGSLSYLGLKFYYTF